VQEAIIIGAGFSGLSAACHLAKAGANVTILEKHGTAGGRARSFHEKGFTFDMGPSWYWMPDVFERFFSQFGKTPQDYYDLVQLDPGFQIIFHDQSVLKIPKDPALLPQLFESIEKGGAERLRRYMAEAGKKYRVSMNELVYSPGLSLLEYLKPALLTSLPGMTLFSSLRQHVANHFKDPRLVSLMEFPVLFLGAMPDRIPALYSMMNYAALKLGTWYPMGGMNKIVQGMEELAVELGVKIRYNSEVSKIITHEGTVCAVECNNEIFSADTVIASADYHHVEQDLLHDGERNYKPAYWDKRVLAPSCLIFFLGVNKKLKRLQHHNLFFDADFEQHSEEIYGDKKWPQDPLFYVCAPSVTDTSVAPAGQENLFVLVPVAPGLKDEPVVHEKIYQNIIRRLEQYCQEPISKCIVYKRSYSVSDFHSDYNALRGNAYGLANTLKQTAILKPRLTNKKVRNLFYAGHLTVPGPGVPPALISGEIAAKQALKQLKSTTV